PKERGAKAPAAQRPPHLGGQTEASQGVAAVLLAIPEGAPSSDPAVDSHPSDCPERSADDASADPGGPASSSPAESHGSPPCAKSKAFEARGPEKEVQVENDAVPAKALGSAKTQPNPASSNWTPEDKR